MTLLAAAAVIAAETAGAVQDTGLDLGLRFAYGVPMGMRDGSAFMSDHVSGQVPIWVDAGYRFAPHLMVGVYVSHGFMGLAGSEKCLARFHCSVRDTRLGIQAQYRIVPRGSIDPWVGVGVGAEWLAISNGGEGGFINVTYSGIEFLAVQGGADFKAAEGLGVGPFLSVSMGQFNSYSGKVANRVDIEEKTLHGWLMFGVRGTYGLAWPREREQRSGP